MISENQLQHRIRPELKEKLQYGLAFGVIATMLMIAEFPMFVILFVGVFAFFLWKTFSTASNGLPREIFEFYLSANDILRDDDRRWFGFEVRDVIIRGEKISRAMPDVPPLVHFTLGALYEKIGDHHQAVRYLSHVIENAEQNEYAIVSPSSELRQYAKILRRIESQPADAPQTSAAIRALGRTRRNRGKALLEASRDTIAELNRKKLEAVNDSPQRSATERNILSTVPNDVLRSFPNSSITENREPLSHELINKMEKQFDEGVNEKDRHRQSITEVLHEIYDRKAR